ncbi:hypothetical protein N1027_18900 [Herbiconiux sp. CPCC 205763]|uniref:Phage holin family protein n=1 Tax=Herbiconiux aconitum TaxID=2970913 RepID=A0ABT2GVH3_9MICO|nr:hypothetical protein [Herbiconiux aconitum]MCS5720205.1 hypothetical protein [Herbiconiux aconitum]
MTGRVSGVEWVMRILSAILLLAIGGIHLYLVPYGAGSVLGVLFTLNGIGGIVLAIAVLALRGRLLQLAVILALLFALASLLSLLSALTVGLFGITEVWSFPLVPQTVVVDAIAVVVLAVTTWAVFRRRRTA